MRSLPAWAPLGILTCLACTGSQARGATGDASGEEVPGIDAGLKEDSGQSGFDAMPLVACDPLSPQPLPLSLGSVVAAGRDSSGTIYVVDMVDGSYRIFASDGGTLVRQPLMSWSRTPANSYTFAVNDHDPAFALRIDMGSDASVNRMGVFFGRLPTETFVIGQQGEELTILSDNDYATMPVCDYLPAKVVMEYAATLPDGRMIVITRPRDQWSYADFRLFFGGVDTMVECNVNVVVRMNDGGSTTIWFDLAGATAVAEFPAVDPDGGSDPGGGTLKTVGGTWPFVLLPSPPVGATYLCFS